MSDYNPAFRDHMLAFNNAIARDALAGGPQAWMYMHTEVDGRDAFKNITTRKYIYVPNTPLSTAEKLNRLFGI